MENNTSIVDKEATGHLTRMKNKFIEDTYLPKDKRKRLLLLSDDL